MSKARIPIIGISHRVVLPSSTHRITIPNFPECIFYIVSRGRKLSMFGVVTYKDPDKRIMYSYGTLVGVLSETPVAKSESIFSGFFDGNFRSFSRSEWQLIIVGVERFKILSISEDSGVNYASITIEKDVDSSINEPLLKELRDRGKLYLRGMNLQEHSIIE